MYTWLTKHQGIIGTIIGLLGIVIALIALFPDWYTLLSDFGKRTITASMFPTVSVIEIQSEFAKDIEILYKKQPVSRLYLVQAKLEYAGQPAIRPEDYEQPLKFVFPQGVDLVEAVVTEKNPENLPVRFDHISTNEASLSPFLFNTGDYLICPFAEKSSGNVN